jgi:hypothetical protein
MAKNKTIRFEVDFQERLAQSRTATDAVRLPRLGYQQYRVYETKKKPDKDALNSLYGTQSYGRILRGKGRSPGILSIVGGSSLQYRYSTVYQVVFDDVVIKQEPKYTVKWLKPKHATLMRIQGTRVEEHG